MLHANWATGAISTRKRKIFIANSKSQIDTSRSARAFGVHIVFGWKVSQFAWVLTSILHIFGHISFYGTRERNKETTKRSSAKLMDNELDFSSFQKKNFLRNFLSRFSWLSHTHSNKTWYRFFVSLTLLSKRPRRLSLRYHIPICDSNRIVYIHH